MVDDWYLTSYRLKIDNDIVGILFVECQKRHEEYKEIFSQKYFQSDILISLIPMATNCSSHKEGTTLVKEDFFVKINELKREW